MREFELLHDFSKNIHSQDSTCPKIYLYLGNLKQQANEVSHFIHSIQKVVVMILFHVGKWPMPTYLFEHKYMW